MTAEQQANELIRILTKFDCDRLDAIADFIVCHLRQRLHPLILICGCGGSAADAQHFAAEIVGRFGIHDRPALPAIALTTDTSIITAVMNDYGPDEIFARQVEALHRVATMLIVFSTSGNSPSVVAAARKAKEHDIPVIAFLGEHGGEVFNLTHSAFLVPSSETSRIQEVHGFAIHVVCSAIDGGIYG